MKEFKNGAVKFELEELNYLSILAFEAAERYKELGSNGLVSEALEMAKKLHEIGAKHGVYEGL